MEAGEIIKGRGQIPWAQKLLLEEITKGNTMPKSNKGNERYNRGTRTEDRKNTRKL